MCSQNQNFLKFISVFHKKRILPKNGISLYELILYSLVHHYQQFRTIPHQNIKEQDILVNVHDLYFFFSILNGLHKFFIVHTGFSLVGFTRHVHVVFRCQFTC